MTRAVFSGVRLSAAGFLAIFALASCGSSSKLTGQSTCRDYAKASPDEQTQIVNQLAQEEGAPHAAGLGKGNIDHLCTLTPSKKLCAAVSRYKPSNVNNGVIVGEDKC